MGLFQNKNKKDQKLFVRPARSERVTRKERKRERERTVSAGTKFFLVCLWVAFVATVLYILFFSQYLRVTSWEVHGGSAVLQDQVEVAVGQKLSGKFLRVLPRNNFFLVWPGRLQRELAAEFPLLREVRVVRRFPTMLSIEMIERPAIVVWCSRGPCYLLDEEARAQEGGRALLPENAERLLGVTDTSGEPITLGEKLFEYDYASFVAALPQAFTERLQITLERQFTTSSRFADEVRLTTASGYQIYVRSLFPLSATLDTLQLFLADELQGEQGNIDYIDLRTENRIFYKLKNAAPATVETPASTSPAAPESKKNDKKKK